LSPHATPAVPQTYATSGPQTAEHVNAVSQEHKPHPIPAAPQPIPAHAHAPRFVEAAWPKSRTVATSSLDAVGQV